MACCYYHIFGEIISSTLLDHAILLLAIYKIVNSNVKCCIIRGYEVIIQDIRSDDNERDTITVVMNSINNFMLGPRIGEDMRIIIIIRLD